MHLKHAFAAAVITVLVSAAPYSFGGALLGDYGPGSVSIACGPGCGDVSGTTFGWAFSVADMLTIDGIGLWDAGADGIGRNILAGLWVEGGALVAQATITDASALEASAGAGGWRMEDIGPTVLGPGNYVLGAVGYNHSTIQQAAFTTLPGITFPAFASRTGGVDPNSGFVRPDLGYDGPLTAYPNLRVVNDVPAPATLLLVLSGLLMLRKFKTHSS